MSKNDDYEAGYQAGRNNFMKDSGSSEYEQGYAHGRQEYDYWNDKNLYPRLRNDTEYSEHHSSSSEPSTLASMIFGSIALSLLWWCLAGLILLLLWIGGSSDGFIFQFVYQVSLWGSIGFIIIMSLAGIVMAIIEQSKK